MEKAPHLGIPIDEVYRLGEADEEIVPAAMRHIQAYNTVAYALGFCDRAVVLNALPIDRMTEFYNESTGLGVTSEHLIEAGRRVWNLEKVWVTMQGQTKADDYPPSRFFDETVEFMRPGRSPVEYPSFPRETFERMLTRYYKSHGWDPNTGCPTTETLDRLDLDWVIDDYSSFVADQPEQDRTPAAAPEPELVCR